MTDYKDIKSMTYEEIEEELKSFNSPFIPWGDFGGPLSEEDQRHKNLFIERGNRYMKGEENGNCT